jgi:hypothetical protein
MTVKFNLFPLGRVLATCGIAQKLAGLGLRLDGSLDRYLARHSAGDWGDVDAEDRAANDWAVVFGDERLLSAYRLADGTRIWVILVTAAYPPVPYGGYRGVAASWPGAPRRLGRADRRDR